MEGLAELQAAFSGATMERLVLAGLLAFGMLVFFVIFIVRAMMVVGDAANEGVATTGGMKGDRFRQHSATIGKGIREDAL